MIQNRLARYSLVAVLGAGLLTLVAVQSAHSAEAKKDVAAPATSAVVGKPAPDFTLVDEGGKKHSLAQYKGKLVVLEWTNPTCPFVVRHYKAETMKKLAAKLGVEVVWLAVNSTHFNKPEDSQKWAKANGLAYPTLQDPAGTVGKLYGARTTPHMFVVDAKGVLRYAGAIDNDTMGREAAPTNYVEGAAGALKAGKDPSPASTEPYGCSVKYKKS